MFDMRPSCRDWTNWVPRWQGLFDSDGPVSLVTTRQTHIGHQHWTMSC